MDAEKQRELIGEILWRKNLPAVPAGEDYFAFGIIIETAIKYETIFQRSG